MDNRMNKYDNVPDRLESRTKRNEALYNSIGKNQIDKYDINSNVSVLDEEPGNEINVEKIKEILSKKYEKPYQRKSIIIEPEPEKLSVSLETKDYDLSKILQQAKAEKPVDYSEERLKKIRNTQYDILSQLNLSKEEKEELPITPEEELMTMIKTITEKESKKNDGLELDLLQDLKGSENTDVVPAITDEQQEQYENQKAKEELDNSFYTDSLKVNPQDFEDFQELKEEITSNSIGIKILIVLFSIVLLFGLLFLFDKLFSWGIF